MPANREARDHETAKREPEQTIGCDEHSSNAEWQMTGKKDESHQRQLAPDTCVQEFTHHVVHSCREQKRPKYIGRRVQSHRDGWNQPQDEDCDQHHETREHGPKKTWSHHEKKFLQNFLKVFAHSLE